MGTKWVRAQEAVPGHSRKTDACLYSSPDIFPQMSPFGKQALWELALAYFIDPISCPFQHISQMEVTQNDLSVFTASEHTFLFPGGHSYASLLSCCAHCSRNVGFHRVFLHSCLPPPLLPLHSLDTGVTFPYNKLYLGGCQLFHLPVRFEARLSVRMYKVQVNRC